MRFRHRVTILILIDGFLQYNIEFSHFTNYNVTILILIDGFLQYVNWIGEKFDELCHNPYFNRWFSAIFEIVVFKQRTIKVTILILIDGFLQLNNIRQKSYISKKSQSLF